jgi:hypothetical protein
MAPSHFATSMRDASGMAPSTENRSGCSAPNVERRQRYGLAGSGLPSLSSRQAERSRKVRTSHQTGLPPFRATCGGHVRVDAGELIARLRHLKRAESVFQGPCQPGYLTLVAAASVGVGYVVTVVPAAAGPQALSGGGAAWPTLNDQRHTVVPLFVTLTW